MIRYASSSSGPDREQDGEGAHAQRHRQHERGTVAESVDDPAHHGRTDETTEAGPCVQQAEEAAETRGTPDVGRYRGSERNEPAVGDAHHHREREEQAVTASGREPEHETQGQNQNRTLVQREWLRSGRQSAETEATDKPEHQARECGGGAHHAQRGPAHGYGGDGYSHARHIFKYSLAGWPVFLER